LAVHCRKSSGQAEIPLPESLMLTKHYVVLRFAWQVNRTGTRKTLFFGQKREFLEPNVKALRRARRLQGTDGDEVYPGGKATWDFKGFCRGE